MVLLSEAIGLPMTDIEFLELLVGVNRRPHNNTGYCHFSWLPTRTWQKDFIMEDITYFGHGTWINQVDTNQEYNFPWSSFFIMPEDTVQSSGGENSSITLACRQAFGNIFFINN